MSRTSLRARVADVCRLPAPVRSRQRQGRQGGPASARAAAPVDLTGMWVSIVTEDWRWRMRTPPKGDYASLPLTAAAIKVADSWDPARDVAAGEQCRPFGGAAIMRVPGRDSHQLGRRHHAQGRDGGGDADALVRVRRPLKPASRAGRAAPSPTGRSPAAADAGAGDRRGADRCES